MEPKKDMHSRESTTSSSFSSKYPTFLRCPTSANIIITFSQVLVMLATVLKAARLPMKQYMGEWRFLFQKMATMTSRFSARLTNPMVKKMWMGTFTSGQSDRFAVVAFIANEVKWRTSIFSKFSLSYNCLKPLFAFCQYQAKYLFSAAECARFRAQSYNQCLLVFIFSEALIMAGCFSSLLQRRLLESSNVSPVEREKPVCLIKEVRRF